MQIENVISLWTMIMGVKLMLPTEFDANFNTQPSIHNIQKKYTCTVI